MPSISISFRVTRAELAEMDFIASRMGESRADLIRRRLRLRRRPPHPSSRVAVAGPVPEGPAAAETVRVSLRVTPRELAEMDGMVARLKWGWMDPGLNLSRIIRHRLGLPPLRRRPGRPRRSALEAMKRPAGSVPRSGPATDRKPAPPAENGRGRNSGQSPPIPGARQRMG